MNILNLIELVIIISLITIIFYQSIKTKHIYSECDSSIEHIINDDFLCDFSNNMTINNKFKKITKKLLKWIYRTLKSSTELNEQIKLLYNSCNKSMEKFHHFKNNFLEINDKAGSALSRIEKLNTLVEDTYLCQKNISELSNKTNKTVENTVDYIHLGNHSVEDSLNILEEMGNYIDMLAENAGTLSEVTDSVVNMAQLINNLSSNINLLSLNASIEAARAGEKGKGFAVVAAEIGKLADKSSSYAENIKSNLGEINNKADQIESSMKKLSNIRSEAKISTNSIKDYFTNINDKINDIVTSIQLVSENVEEGLSYNKEIKNSSNAVTEFFYKFNEDIKTMNQDTENQYKIEETNIKSCDNMSNSISLMLQFTQEFENIIYKKLLNHCNILNEKLEQNALDIPTLKKYCSDNGISEIYITDEDGVVFLTNNDNGINFRFTEDKTSQSHIFRNLLTNKTEIINQNFVKRDLDNKYYKFVAIARKDKPGIIQAGLDIEDIVNLKN